MDPHIGTDKDDKMKLLLLLYLVVPLEFLLDNPFKGPRYSLLVEYLLLIFLLPL